MPILVYFKEPGISLMLKGTINQPFVALCAKEMKKAKLGPVLHFENPDGANVLVFPHKNLDIAYMMELTMEDYEKMKADLEELKKQKAAAMARGGGKIIDPLSFIPGRGSRH